ncbi:hypothetical protein RLOatenuis_0810 [Rickettsiales bacterium]|nr:hypothetical protein RLOatenuis_0810 [Rickettsiales bacterium]
MGCSNFSKFKRHGEKATYHHPWHCTGTAYAYTDRDAGDIAEPNCSRQSSHKGLYGGYFAGSRKTDILLVEEQSKGVRQEPEIDKTQFYGEKQARNEKPENDQRKTEYLVE